uniref:A-kinase anchor protein 7-like phosphoesterase domain-containing protein n=1 Tax=Panagrolaimus sp. JU765 TaxID=591449 RepID=A0AC34RAL9_9BILA
MAKVLIVVFLAIVSAVGFGIQTQKAFVGVRITNQQIKSQVRLVQKTLVHLDQRFLASLAPIDALHLTFNFYNVSQNNLDPARKALTISAESYVWHFGGLSLDFQGISTAENGTRLVFGLTPESSTKIEAFYGITTEAFRGQGFESLNRDFHPQITIAALQPSESPVLKSKMRRLVNSEFYFGKQMVQRLDLCSEVIDRGTGYFGILAEAEFPL